jgi:putative two-component system response regulator
MAETAPVTSDHKGSNDSQGMTSSTKRILVADDDSGIRGVLYEFLTMLGFEIEMASDGFETLAKMELDIDLLITDANMPGLDGFEVVRRVRANPNISDVPIIMITGSSERGDRILAAEAGVNDFITKPIDFTELQLRTKTLLKMKEMYDALKRHKEELEQTVVRRTESLRKALDQLVSEQRSLRDANLESIQRLVVATEYRDRGTAAHIRRMSQVSAILARKVRMTPLEVELILHASPMHDIGKIATPEEILLKPGKLEEHEWQVMRQHTHIGADILKDSPFDLLKAGEIIAISHHERWDGLGYPNKLSGESIPIEGRICAVADVFDALTSERSYKRAFSIDESVKIIQEEAGSHFDPKVVDALMAALPEVVEIRQRIL